MGYSDFFSFLNNKKKLTEKHDQDFFAGRGSVRGERRSGKHEGWLGKEKTAYHSDDIQEEHC